MKTISFLTLTTLASATLASSAHAHINVEIGGQTGRNGNQKDVPCDGAPGDGTAFTFEPGATITLTVDENITHPGYYRVAFDDDGEDFKDPRSIEPVEGQNRTCPGDKTFDKCGEPDFCNTPEVLFDNLNPHLNPIPFLGPSVTWNIKLPDIECENCVLQVLQVMMDDIAHGPYCAFDDDACKLEPKPTQDVYHRCFDIKLVKGATNSPGATTDPVSLPEDKKYIDCRAGGETDAGLSTVEQPSEVGDGSVDDEPTGDIDSKQDAAVKKDAGVKKDASTVSNDDGAAVDDGCALASSSEGATWTLLALGLLLTRRRRS